MPCSEVSSLASQKSSKPWIVHGTVGAAVRKAAVTVDYESQRSKGVATGHGNAHGAEGSERLRQKGPGRRVRWGVRCNLVAVARTA